MAASRRARRRAYRLGRASSRIAQVKDFALCNRALSLDIDAVIFLKWTLPLLSKRTVKIDINTKASITSSDGGENIFFPPTTR